MANKIYLGDSVYLQISGAEHGYWPGIVLTTEDGTTHATNTIYLEPEVQLQLAKVIEQVRKVPHA